METKLSSSNVKNINILIDEVRALFFGKGKLNLVELKCKNWTCITLDDNQILGEDAECIVDGLGKMGVSVVYGAWVVDFLNHEYFEVDVFGVDVASIEKLQNPWSRIDHADSFIFSEYPLKFLIYRPDTCQDRLMVMGPDSFVEPLIKLGGWKLYEG